MPAPLDAFLRYITGGNDTLTPEMYAHFGGDDILKEMQKYDPGYHWEESDMGGGEGATSVMGKKLVGSTAGQMVLPTSKSGIDFLNLRPSNFGELKNPNAVFHDDVYGDVTHAGNVKKDIGTLDKALPYIAAAISMGGPMLGAALAGAGIGGAAGLTSSVTGGAAGLSSGSIPGAMGAGTFGGSSAPSWLTNAVKSAPRTLDTVKAGNFDAQSLLPTVLGAAGVDPTLSSAINGGVNLARGGEFNPLAFLPVVAQQLGIDPGMVKTATSGLTLAQLAQAFNKQRRT